MITLKQFFENQSEDQREKLQTCLGVSRQNVNHWLTEDTAPKPEVAFELIEYTRGVLTWESIYLPYVLKKINAVDPRQMKLPIESSESNKNEKTK